MLDPIVENRARASKREAKKRRKDDLARASRDDAAKRQEAQDERIAPRAQRETRLVRDGNTFRAASPLLRLYKAGLRRTGAGDMPAVCAEHIRATERLHRAWEASQTISCGVSSYGDVTRGTVQSGYLSQSMIDNINRQQASADEVVWIRLALGPLWGVMEAVALRGMDLRTWNETARLDAMAASGYLRASLDMLVEFYARLGPGGERIPVAR